MDHLKPYIQLLLPGHCYKTFLVDFNFFDEACIKIFISKVLGYSIILGSILVKLPQILKILAAKSGAGLSMPSLLLEQVALTATCAYGIDVQFPFSVFGDAAFLMLQTAIIAAMVLIFSNQAILAIIYLTIHSGICWYLFSGLAPSDLIWGLQSSGAIVLIASKMMQVYENYKNGSTGQLSAITVILISLGSAAKIFTVVQETEDMTFLVTVSIALACNVIILAQLIAYWNVDSVDKKKKVA
ncbi:mannose-P-dolichol utilization defect 1 protein-like [Watersipora subatra]|uniref:mannose-P-dolichol utilization defect 1 protein-like n=1 Tax=Watersipora subatra TaxID=2589382 RepID=UPI00355C5535